VNAVMNSPARQYRNVIQMSQHAPFVDAAVSIDENNYGNTFISYYTYGSFIGLTLDLNIRNRFAGKSLDDVMKYMWEHFGKTEIPYEIPDIQKAVATVTGDAKFANDFFNQYVYKSEVPNVQALLADMGVTVRKKNTGKVDFANIRLDYKEDGAVITTGVLKNTSLYQAGLNRGDKILEINNQAVKNAADFKLITEKITASRGCDITFVQNGITHSVKFTALEDPMLEILLQEKPSDAAMKKRKEWLKK
jgi:predicted metalloprotease with PDZ domain